MAKAAQQFDGAALYSRAVTEILALPGHLTFAQLLARVRKEKDADLRRQKLWALAHLKRKLDLDGKSRRAKAVV